MILNKFQTRFSISRTIGLISLNKIYSPGVGWQGGDFPWHAKKFEALVMF